MWELDDPSHGIGVLLSYAPFAIHKGVQILRLLRVLNKINQSRFYKGVWKNFLHLLVSYVVFCFGVVMFG